MVGSIVAMCSCGWSGTKLEYDTDDPETAIAVVAWQDELNAHAFHRHGGAGAAVDAEFRFTPRSPDA